MNDRLVILGASARAAAEAAVRAGFEPAAADLFGDRDLRALADWVPIDNYPDGVPAAARQLPPGPWIYTGGLENYPDLIDQIALTRPLFGNASHVLRSVRDPFRLANCLREAGLDYPEISLGPPPYRARQHWLRKPQSSCGGHGIERWRLRHQHFTQDEESRHSYFQKFVRGTSHSAVFVAAKGRASLLGVTRQLVGSPWTGAKQHAYCGSLGPISLDAAMTSTLERIGNRIAESFGLVGLLGVDLIFTGKRVFVIEVNPRFPASAEIIERALAGSRRLMSDHVHACCTGILPPKSAGCRERTWGKAVLFATQRIRIGEQFFGFVERTNRDANWPPLADIPYDGTEIEAGHPLLTVRVEARTPREAGRALQRMAGAVRAIVDVRVP